YLLFTGNEGYLFNVNWFRKDAGGNYLWPGYGDNIRALKWIFERLEGADNAVETAVGYVPKPESIDISGLEGIEKNLPELLKVDRNEWLAETELVAGHFESFGRKLPEELKKQFSDLRSRLDRIQ
ncbi:MAG TPA: phosphoenolpyruvate carboxykinase domain-containing protein, partial [Bacteroidales bacterium]|nr:phosphoenolpyruvate carboxykinase domain-containing protein [Bacteroidales bacterium]